MARDFFHNHVKEAIEKIGWKVTDESYRMRYGNREIELDLGAERLIAAEKGVEKIYIEVKSFLSKSVFYELHEAIGQYKNYKRILRLTNQERPLYLAMPLDAYEELFQDEFGKLTIEEEELKIIVYQPSNKTIVKWIN